MSFQFLGKWVMRRVHGKPLQARWRKKGCPPVWRATPARGALGLERNHPFACKMNPVLLLGPKCNHDIGILLRLPALSEERQRELLNDFGDGSDRSLV